MKEIDKIKEFLPINYEDSNEFNYVNALLDDIDLILNRYNDNEINENDSYNNITMFNNCIFDITLIYTYIVQTIVVRIYKKNENNLVEFYKHFINKNFSEISMRAIRIGTLENDELIDFITFYIKNSNSYQHQNSNCNIEKIIKKIKDAHNEVFCPRNQIAHMNAQLYKYDSFLKLCKNIIKSLSYLYNVLFYTKNIKQVELIQKFSFF